MSQYLTLRTPEDGIPTLRKLPYALDCSIPSERLVTARAADGIPAIRCLGDRAAGRYTIFVF